MPGRLENIVECTGSWEVCPVNIKSPFDACLPWSEVQLNRFRKGNNGSINAMRCFKRKLTITLIIVVLNNLANIMINEKIQQGDVLIQCTMLLKMHDKNRQFQYLVQFGLGKHQQNHEEESDSWFHRVKIGKAGGMEEGRKEEGPSFPPSSIPPSSMLLTDP